jgi:hypothetical protein
MTSAKGGGSWRTRRSEWSSQCHPMESHGQHQFFQQLCVTTGKKQHQQRSPPEAWCPEFLLGMSHMDDWPPAWLITNPSRSQGIGGVECGGDLKKTVQPGVALHICDPSIWAAEA